MSELKKCPFAESAGKRIITSLRSNAFFTSAWGQIDKGVGRAFFENLVADIICVAWRESSRFQADNEPLTLEELRGMKGEKIRIHYIGYCEGVYDDVITP